MIGLYLITELGPFNISTPLRTQTQLDKLNINTMPTYIINSRNQQILMCCNKDFN